MADFECDDCRITAECTEQCRVVPCTDLSLCQDDAPCDGNCVASDCVECTGWDDIFQCCQDDHVYDPNNMVRWANSFSDMLCPCDTDPGIIPLQNTSQDIYHSATFGSSGTSSVSTTPSPLLSASQHTPTASVRTHACMWANCGLVFASLSELVGHVNLQHLRPPVPVPAPNIPSPSFSPTQDAQLFPSNSALSCHWGDCSMDPNLTSISGSSSGPGVDQVISLLATHLMQDHLGLNTPLLGHPGVSSPLPDQPTVPSVPSSSPAISRTPTPQEPSSPATPSTPGNHPCKWQSCGQIFISSDELTAHIASVHIGSGRAHYNCFWEGCSRNGDSGFSSKQKISRHLQSHTGHRPFQCQICQQNFSEAATLQQHMRRHTHEKPYVCDHPGCGKAFSITGALTIHKRTHNGLRPFKCSYCDKAFSESSNLSKHLRTHTGARPYACIQPSCKKSFARPDQLARHASVHRKKDIGS